MEYIVIFDAANEGIFTIVDALILFGIWVLLIVLFKYPKLNPNKKYLTTKQFKNLMVVLFLGVNVAQCTSIRFSLDRIEIAEKRYRDESLKVTEGVVKDFVPMPYTGHARESFTVNNVKFEYSDFVITGGFNNTASHGGPLREGLQVRISHVGNIILKLEVEKNANKAFKGSDS